MNIQEFNECANNEGLLNMTTFEIKTRAEWLQCYVEDTERTWSSPEDMIKQLTFYEQG
jgi:hypothetical protein